MSRRTQQGGGPGKHQIAADLAGKGERRQQLGHGRGIAVPAAAIMTAMDTPVAYFDVGSEEAVAGGDIHLVTMGTVVPYISVFSSVTMV